MEALVAIIGVLLGFSISIYVQLLKANKVIKILIQDEPIFRSMQLEYSLRKQDA